MVEEIRLGEGASGEAVETVQRALAKAGFFSGQPDGRFGPLTERAVREFQINQGIQDDGVVGPETQQALESLIDEPLPPEAAMTEAPFEGEAPDPSSTSTDDSATDIPSTTPGLPLDLSPSVSGLLRREQELTSFELAADVWAGHRNYPEHERAPETLLEAGEDVRSTLEERSPADWIGAVQAAIDPAQVVGTDSDRPTLHGQLLLYGLGRIDAALGDAYRKNGYDNLLRSAIKPDPEPLFAQPTAPPVSIASPDAKLIADTPSKIDLLDREGFANTMARLLRQQRSQSEFGTGAIPVQLFGPWGSGKTSLAGFLRKSLEQSMPAAGGATRNKPPTVDEQAAEGPWLFVTFDAWQHQRTAPPWWWLMDRVYQEARGHHSSTDERDEPALPPGRRLSVWWWRWRWALLSALIVTTLTLGLILLGSRLTDWIDSAQATLVSIVALGGVLGTLLAAYRGLRSSLLVGSPRTAVALLRSGGDPFRRVKDKYNDLIKRIRLPVLVFIDNLDRCQPAYVVELLEGIQTTFADVRVTYLIAADREWIAQSFEEQYKPFTTVMGRPGRPLGYLFLEKTFAVSAPLPQPSSATRDRYWRSVLHGGRQEDDEAAVAALEPISPAQRQAAMEEFAGKRLDEVIDAVENLDAMTPQDRARREAAAIRIVETTISGEQDHELRPYLALMEANPRSLKRLRNSVSIARAGDLAGGGSIASDDDLDGLIRWTILSLRWPTLSIRLAKQPDAIVLLAAKEDVTGALGRELAPLTRDEGLHKLLSKPVEGGSEPDLLRWIKQHLADHDQPVPT